MHQIGSERSKSPTHHPSENMKLTNYRFLVTGGLLLLPSFSMQAAVDSLLTLNAKCYSQQKLTTTPDRVVGEVTTTRLETKQLLAMLAKDAGLRYTNGSRLKVVAGAIFVADSNGKVLGNVSKYFQFKVDTNSNLFQGNRNLMTGEERTQSYQPMTFTIHLPKLKANVSGLLTNSVRISSPNKLGVQEAFADGNANISGEGLINRNLGYIEGTFELRGHEAILNR